ncbi:MAG: hypothetical protein ABJ338_14080 [Lentilitoribacter sp.]
MFGNFTAKWSDGTPLSISGDKKRVLLAMLATAAEGRHSRSWLQETLWGRAGEKNGRASLRKTLTRIKAELGEDNYDVLFKTTYSEIQLDLDSVELVGHRLDGEFLEGINFFEMGFRKWLRDKRDFYEKGAISVDHKARQRRIVPSIAVVPFLSFTNNPDERHLGDMVSLEISRTLSRSNMINVISHLASRQFCTSSVELEAVKSSLDIDYLVSGTINVRGEQFRLDIDFIDVSSGFVIWSDSFNGKMKDFFRSDCESVITVSNRIGYAILSASIELSMSKPMPDVPSHALLMSSIGMMHSNDFGQFKRAKEGLKELVYNRKIKDSKLQAWLALWYMMAIPQGWAKSFYHADQCANDCANQALDIDPSCAFSLAIDGMVKNGRPHTLKKAVAQLREAKINEPNNSFAWLMDARIHAFEGDGENAVLSANKALLLSPVGPQKYFYENIAATAFLSAEKYDHALDLIEKSLAVNAKHRSSLRVKTIALYELDRLTEAKETMSFLRTIDSGLTVQNYLETHPAGRNATGILWANALEKSGLPQS